MGGKGENTAGRKEIKNPQGGPSCRSAAFELYPL